MQAFSREDRVLQELKKIAFGDRHVICKLKSNELLGKHVELFKQKDLPEKTRTPDEIKSFIELNLAILFD